MNVIKKRADVIENLINLEKMLQSKKKEERDFVLDRILNEPHIVIYKALGENHFGPASMIGVKKWDMKDDKNPPTEDEFKEIKKALNDVVGTAFVNDTTNEKYQEYAVTLIKKVPKVDRQYWRVKDERGKNLNLTEKDLK